MKQFASFYKPFIFYSKRINFQYFDRQIKKKKNSKDFQYKCQLKKNESFGAKKFESSLDLIFSSLISN